jgi:hypothetical protein
MSDDGELKDDVKVPDGEIGDKIEKLFTTEEKDTSTYPSTKVIFWISFLTLIQTSLSSPPWVSSLPLRPRRLHVVKQFIPMQHYNLGHKSQQ